MKTPRVSFAAFAQRLFACVGLLATVVAIGAAQQIPPASPQNPPAQPIFRTGINTVLVDFRVVDLNDKFVGDLKQDEVRVFEDDKEQTVTTFSLVNIPIETRREPATRTSRVLPDVVSNSQTSEGRLYLIVLDDAPPTPFNRCGVPAAGEFQSHPLRAPTVRALAHEFVERHLAAGDQAAVVTMSGRRDMKEEFTHDPQRLLAAIDRFEGNFGSELVWCNADLTLASFATWLGQIQGRRKAVVFITENVRPIVDHTEQMERVLEATARANVSLYIMDPTGVPTGTATGIKPVPLDDVLDLKNAMDRRMALDALAEWTGGFASGTQSNDYAAAFDRIVEENSSYYLLGYTPTNNQQDGKLRKIRVEVMRPGPKVGLIGEAFHVRSRTGYVAEKPRATAASTPDALPADLAELMKSPISVGGLTLAVTAMPFRLEGPLASVSVVVEAKASDLFFANQDARFNGVMDLAIVAVDLDGKTQGGESGKLTMRLLPETHQTVAAQGVRMLSSLQLKPGRYHLKVAATDAGGGQMRGSVTYDVTVPDFSKEMMTMSGLALASLASARTPTNGVDNRWKTPLGVPPTTTRVFSPGDTLRVYVEVYDKDLTPGHQARLTTTIRDLSGRAVFNRPQNLPFQATGASKVTTYRVTPEIPLKDIPAGEYVLTVEARHSNSAIPPASRQIPFSISVTR